MPIARMLVSGLPSTPQGIYPDLNRVVGDRGCFGVTNVHRRP